MDRDKLEIVLTVLFVAIWVPVVLICMIFVIMLGMFLGANESDFTSIVMIIVMLLCALALISIAYAKTSEAISKSN